MFFSNLNINQVAALSAVFLSNIYRISMFYPGEGEVAANIEALHTEHYEEGLPPAILLPLAFVCVCAHVITRLFSKTGGGTASAEGVPPEMELLSQRITRAEQQLHTEIYPQMAKLARIQTRKRWQISLREKQAAFFRQAHWLPRLFMLPFFLGGEDIIHLSLQKNIRIQRRLEKKASLLHLEIASYHSRKQALADIAAGLNQVIAMA